MAPDAPPQNPKRRRKTRHWLYLAIGALLVYLVGAYLLIPILWEAYVRRHPSFDDNPRLTKTRTGHPGDPLNVALVGSEAQLKEAMRVAEWFPAAALGLRSDLKIAADTIISRPDDQAPVSNLYLFGRKEDLAYEKPVGDNPRQRHHVRFWRSDVRDRDGRTTWIGSASYDERVGISHTTGQVTHHIAADVDAERDHLFDDLKRAGVVTSIDTVDDFHHVREGRNGGGDHWYTDGRLMVGILKAN